MGSASGGATGSGGVMASGGAMGSGGTAGKGAGGGTAPGSGGTAGGPINVLIWNNALAYGHQARTGAIQYLKARESTDNIKFDTTYAHLTSTEGPSDTSFDASVFDDTKLAAYDVVFFLDTTGTTIDDSNKNTRRQALQDFIEKKQRASSAPTRRPTPIRAAHGPGTSTSSAPTSATTATPVRPERRSSTRT